MKKLFLLFTITIIGCDIKEDHTQETSNYIDAIKYINRENNSNVHRIEKSIVYAGRKDTIILKAAMEVITNSNDVVNKKQPLDKHYESLIVEYNLIERKDTASLNRAYRFLTKFNESKDSSYYYNYLLNAMMLESNILDFYSEQVGATNIIL